MRVDLFDFELPEERIALFPAEPRDSARLLQVGRDGSIADRVFTDLEDLLRPNDLLILNDTRVLRTELFGTRHREDSEAAITFNLYERVDESTWAAFARPAKRLRFADKVVFGGHAQAPLVGIVSAVGEEGTVNISFEIAGEELDEAINQFGSLPLPPYILSKRSPKDRDQIDYQTVYADKPGAVAAPTAGLHFSEELLQRIRDIGVGIETVTLHVGPGTYRPVKVDDTDDHVMHAEWGSVSSEVIAHIELTRSVGGRVVAVGTTSLRLLEAVAQRSRKLAPFTGETDIFITPGFQFRVADMLLTNFHLPRSTLFMLVSAFGGLMTMKRAYMHAIDNEYRFYSYGDAMLIGRPGGQP
jgi:S-adenosylmethionine:tRNA ribosyltransferase-isomerase